MLKKLTFVDLTSNKISVLDAFANLADLTEVYLARNEITNLKPLSSLKNLKAFTLNDNPIYSLANRNEENCPTKGDIPEVLRDFCSNGAR